MNTKIIILFLLILFALAACGGGEENSVQQMQIAFTSNRDGNDEIYLMDADGSNLRRLTNNSVNDWYPAWRPAVAGGG